MTQASAFVLGYHGCDRAIGEKVLKGREHLKASENDYDWLGTGIYFWANSARRALDWAIFARENPRFVRTKIEEPYVVGAIIDLGFCLDLLEAESIAIVAEGYKGLCEGAETAGLVLPSNKRVGGAWAIRRLDCAVINYVHETRKLQDEREFDSVRAPFIEGAPLYKNAGFYERTRVQICVRRPEQIIGYFCPITLP
jgi:hypothetical protein